MMLSDSPADKASTPRQTSNKSTSRAAQVRRMRAESSVTFMAFLCILVVFGVRLQEQFVDVEARLLDVHQNVPILLLALAAVVTLIPGLFDLSIAGVATLTSFLVVGLRVKQDWPFPLVIIAALAVGALVGLVNAFLVERLRVNGFIATLGTGAICAGLSAVYSGGTTLAPLPDSPQLADWFLTFGTFTSKAPTWLTVLAYPCGAAALYFGLNSLKPESRSPRQWFIVRVTLVLVTAVLAVMLPTWSWLSNISSMIMLLLIVSLALWVLLEYTTYGRHIRAIGSNRAAAELAGVKVKKQIVKTFVLGGTVSALAGITLAASQASAAPDAAANFLLPAFAAAFLSTVVLSHGRFTVPGAVIGGIFIVWVGLALIISGVAPTWIAVVNGTLLVSAVALSTAMKKT